MKKILLSAVLLGWIGLFSAIAQTSKEKAAALAAEFSKEKDKSKEMDGVDTKKHKEVEARLDSRTDISGYAAIYLMEGLGQYFQLKQGDDKNWQGEFYQETDGKKEVTAWLEEIRIEDALLTGQLKYKDGKTEPFQAVFINRFENGEDRGSGIGIKQALNLTNGFTVDKAYYKRQ